MSSSLIKYTFDLPRSSLIYIDTDFSLLSSWLSSEPILIGIDTETKPCRIRNHVNPTSLIQIAIRNVEKDEKVFVLDLLRLSKNKQSFRILDELLLTIFNDVKVIKIGQGLQQDFRQLSQRYPHMISFSYCNCILDTNKFFRFLNPDATNDISLRELTRIFLYYDLDKSFQMSNWGARPLSEGQILYAACDALILLRLYDVMLCEAKVQHSHDFKIGTVLLTFDANEIVTKKRKRKKNKILASYTEEVIEFDENVTKKAALNPSASPSIHEPSTYMTNKEKYYNSADRAYHLHRMAQHKRFLDEDNEYDDDTNEITSKVNLFHEDEDERAEDICELTFYQDYNKDEKAFQTNLFSNEYKKKLRYKRSKLKKIRFVKKKIQ